MQKYIGTKIIEAEPMSRSRGDKAEDGYKVRYPDGYESWSPKDVFNEAYRPTDCMNFGLAIEAMKKGKKVARRGWNGKGMFLVLCPGSEVPADHIRVKPVKKFYQQEGRTSVIIAPHIDLKAADGTYVTGWLASQTDMLADDWEVVE